MRAAIRVVEPKVPWEVGRARLETLAKFLDEEVPAKRFDYQVWASDRRSARLELSPSCGTTACAMGWATAVPEFQALGLRFEEGHLTTRRDSLEGGIASAMSLFGVTYDEGELLFVPGREGRVGGEVMKSPDDNYSVPDERGNRYRTAKATAKEVAAHIRKFIVAKDRLEHELGMMAQKKAVAP